VGAERTRPVWQGTKETNGEGGGLSHRRRPVETGAARRVPTPKRQPTPDGTEGAAKRGGRFSSLLPLLWQGGGFVWFRPNGLPRLGMRLLPFMLRAYGPTRGKDSDLFCFKHFYYLIF
jgi:hypothetical protein